MLLGVLRMPLPEGCECLSNPLSQVAQFVDRGRQAADLIEQQAAEIERLRAKRQPDAWLYEVDGETRLHKFQIDHFYSLDGGESFIKGTPLYRSALAEQK